MTGNPPVRKTLFYFLHPQVCLPFSTKMNLPCFLLSVSFMVLTIQEVHSQRCIWLTGRFGQYLKCPYGYVGRGACGSGRHADCKQHGKHWTELRCCQIGNPQVLRYNCNTQRRRYGWHNSCVNNKAVFSLCGSGRHADCGTNAWTKIRCCSHTGLNINNSKCGWIYGHYGTYLRCSKGYVLTGVCGSGQNADCPHQKFHGVRCCRLI